MSKFILTESQDSLASQITNLLNTGGQLIHKLAPGVILGNNVRYMIEMDQNTVAGVVGMEQFGYATEVKHLCVHPDYRRRGLGIKLLRKAVAGSPTNCVYGMVRSDNLTNIRNNLRIGMKPIGKRRGRGCHIIIFARRKNGG